jgi:hypothetical protein
MTRIENDFQIQVNGHRDARKRCVRIASTRNRFGPGDAAPRAIASSRRALAG